MQDISKIEKTINYTFKNKELLLTALSHTSYSNENDVESYQRLEFLGDSILGFIVAKKLFDAYPDKDEGVLSKMRASIVCEESLSEFARQVGLKVFIKLGVGEEKSNGREKSSILSDVFEAVLGAVYLDSDFNTAKEWLDDIITDDCYLNFTYSDFKTMLQEKYKNKTVEYHTSDNGNNSKAQFLSKVYIDGKVYGSGVGTTKKSAEQAAAKTALNR